MNFHQPYNADYGDDAHGEEQQAGSAILDLMTGRWRSQVLHAGVAGSARLGGAERPVQAASWA